MVSEEQRESTTTGSHGETSASSESYEEFRRQSPLDVVLDRLGHVARLPNGDYQASCPTDFHPNGDRSRGLRVAEGEDGRVLLWCPAGCTALDITGALGLDMSDLFPQQRTRRSGPNLRKVLDDIEHEAMVIVCAAGLISQGKSVDLDRVKLAGQRIRSAIKSGGHRYA